MRLVGVLRALKGVDQKFSAGELALLNDHAKHDWRSVIEKVTFPVLFVAGDGSELWPSTHAQASAQLAKAGSAVVIARSGHAANVEQPKRFNAAMTDFLARL